MKYFITTFFIFLSEIACAQATGAEKSPSIMMNVLMLGGFIFLFYFMLIRPQTKKQKEHQNLITKLAKDDEVVTSGGILGKVVKVTDQFLIIAVAENLQVTVQKQAIAASLPKGTMKNI